MTDDLTVLLSAPLRSAFTSAPHVASPSAGEVTMSEEEMVKVDTVRPLVRRETAVTSDRLHVSPLLIVFPTVIIM